jgi:hypothetical protein
MKRSVPHLEGRTFMLFVIMLQMQQKASIVNLYLDDGIYMKGRIGEVMYDRDSP